MDEQIEVAKRRALEITAELAEMKRKYLVEGINGPQGKRAALEAEAAQIALQLFEFKVETAKRKKAAQDAKANSFVSILTRKVQEPGFSHLVDESHAEALEAITDAGLLEDLRGRT